MSRFYRRPLEGILVLCVLGMPVSCATIRVNTIPPPPPTAKLRIYVHPLTGPGRWNTSHEAFVENQIRGVEKHLKKTGIYEVVSATDIRAALGGQQIERWQLEQDGWALAREIGLALHADYLMVMERILQPGESGGREDFAFVNVLVNAETGKVFESRTRLDRITRADRGQQRDLVRETYRNIFNSGSKDMLATAVKKGFGAVPANIPGTKQEILKPSAPVQKQEAGPNAAAAVPKQPMPAAGPDAKQLGVSPPVPGPGTVIVVYDLDAPDQYRTVALILSEALREELFRLNRFVLVSRENLQLVLQEMAMQQSGLIDEKLAVRTGKGLAANQVITGKIGLLGKTILIQAKRIDVETLATIGLASAKFTVGQEDEVLTMLPDLAKSLTGLR